MHAPSDRRSFVKKLGQTAVAGGLVWRLLPSSITQAATVANMRTGEGWIDAHVHVWTPDTKKYPLDKTFKLSDMQPPSFTPDELLAHCKPVGVDRVVLIQMSFYGLDHSYMLDAMSAHPGVFSAVALIDHQSDSVAKNAKDLVSRGAKGFRIHSHGDAKDWPTSKTMQQLWKTAADEGFAVCPLINPQDIQFVDKLCEQFPKTRVVVDHFARIGVSGTVEQDRLDELCKLARHPNVYVKVSAYYALGKKQAPYHDLKAMIRQVLKAYGPERLMWATDCPYQVQGEHTYKASLDLILNENEFLTASDKQWILRDTATKVFFG